MGPLDIYSMGSKPTTAELSLSLVLDCIYFLHRLATKWSYDTRQFS
jgi:hypothetical protein